MRSSVTSLHGDTMRTTLIERVLRVVYNTEFMLSDDDGILAYNDMFVFTISEDLCVQVKYGDVILLDKTFKSSFACAV